MANGRSATVPGSNTVSMWPMHEDRGPLRVRTPQLADDGLAQVLVVLVRRHRKPRIRSRSGGPAADGVDAGLRVAAAVGVHEPFEVGEIGRGQPARCLPAARRALPVRRGRGRSEPYASLSARDSAPRAGHPDSPDRSSPRAAPRCPSRRFPTVRLVEIRLLEAPTSTGCCRSSRSRSRSADANLKSPATAGCLCPCQARRAGARSAAHAPWSIWPLGGAASPHR